MKFIEKETELSDKHRRTVILTSNEEHITWKLGNNILQSSNWQKMRHLIISSTTESVGGQIFRRPWWEAAWQCPIKGGHAHPWLSIPLSRCVSQKHSCTGVSGHRTKKAHRRSMAVMQKARNNLNLTKLYSVVTEPLQAVAMGRSGSCYRNGGVGTAAGGVCSGALGSTL